ncbi:NADH-quinone oxidoreductase subunit N [Desulfuromonas sp. AOP6]|uniref:NADH-quinone oxidoreductase subunit N n=1 Tax=Desulfuromonas sp. AOP6 TaxID=1566351 RepID=UPI00126CFC70|nr:NADH-quinone oxidoreductase subunit N [Desulfuromonas sp. AOP6]BCA80921.1 NADH-quinone oxidoreductase subunit N [Desulfuromonas sp. AOP6]
MTLLELHALLPVLLLAAGAVALLLAGAWQAHYVTAMTYGVLIALGAAAIALFYEPATASTALGLFTMDSYSRFFAVLWSLLAALTLLMSFRYGQRHYFLGGEYAALILFAAAGMILLSSASSFFGLFLGLETFTLVFYILIAFHKGSPLGAEAGLKYLIMGGVATGLLAMGIALIYAATGTFHFDSASLIPVGDQALRPLLLAGWALLLGGLGFKTSLVPFHLWTPDVYEGAPSPVTALLATGSKGAVFAALVLLFAGSDLTGSPLGSLLWLLSALSMAVGTLCALRQHNLKRMLAYSSVVHMGYLLLALLPAGSNGSGAILFYLVAYSGATLGAFAVLTVFSTGESEAASYDHFRGVGYRQPLAALVLLICMLSLAGIPPTAGFMGKFSIFYAAIEGGYTGLALIGILSSLISLAYYLRPVMVMYMAGTEDGMTVTETSCSAAEKSVLILCLLVTLLLGVYPGPLFDTIALILP